MMDVENSAEAAYVCARSDVVMLFPMNSIPVVPIVNDFVVLVTPS